MVQQGFAAQRANIIAILFTSVDAGKLLPEVDKARRFSNAIFLGVPLVRDLHKMNAQGVGLAKDFLEARFDLAFGSAAVCGFCFQ